MAKTHSLSPAQALEELRREDPETPVTLHFIRSLVKSGKIPSIRIGRGYLLIALSEAFETSVSTLLGDAPEAAEADTLKAISEKLEVINLQLAQKNCSKRRVLHWVFVTLAALMVIGFAVLFCVGSPYLGWDWSDPETAVFGAAFHAFEFAFVRLAPIVLIGSLIGIALTNKKD